ncbi:helix-turn-helix transcriptional regulator [Pantoea rwandensis]|nr:LuxR C-terminal-related transcriptional regulator [Pantoea rwandensis]
MLNHKNKNIMVITPNPITYYGIRAMLTTLPYINVAHCPIHFRDEAPTHIERGMHMVIIDTEIANADIISELIKSCSLSSSVVILTHALDYKTTQKYKMMNVRAILQRKSSQKEVESAVFSVLENNEWGFEDHPRQLRRGFTARELSPSIKDEQAMLSLSATERTIIRSIYRGRTVTDIAVAKEKSIKTISSQKQAAMRKLNVKNLAELHVRYHRYLD